MRCARPPADVCLLTVILVALVIPSALASDRTEEMRDATLPTRPIRTIDLSKFNAGVVKDLERAWISAGNGKDRTESVVLLFRAVEGGYVTRLLPPTNEHKKSTFDLPIHALAIFHTHPMDCSPRPSPEDIQIADKRKILMFTITAFGMYVYDPHTKKTTLVMNGVDWLETAKWTESVATRMASISPAFKTDSSQISSR